jgi:hypothetical protein
MNEMTEEGTRFLLAREEQVGSEPGRLVAFAHFRFTIQGTSWGIFRVAHQNFSLIT